MLLKVVGGPLAKSLEDLLLFSFDLEALAEESSWCELIFRRVALWMEDSPAAVKYHVGNELLVALVGINHRPVDSYDLTAPLADW
jgi:hypothetical protein